MSEHILTDSYIDSYNDAVSNRSLFPLDNGYITLNSEHPMWTGELEKKKIAAWKEVADVCFSLFLSFRSRRAHLNRSKPDELQRL